MIVDLMRNDLGRVAEYGSVEAPAAPEAQPHAGVWHLVSEVHARLAPDQGDAALLRATFPPGSVTGAPKVQAMKVIAALEATGREVYTGAIGFASPHAGLELNVAIRTFEAHSGHLWLGAGGGIVADSDPEAELEECLVKARPLIAAINGHIKPDPSQGVFDTLRVEHGVAVNLDAHLARLAHSVATLYGEELPEIAVPVDRDGAVRITYVPGAPPTVVWRAAKPRALPIVLTPHVVPGGLGEHKWVDRRLVEALSKDGTTPLLLDADGTVLEAAWATVLIRRDGRLYTPREDGRILPSTSRPDARSRRPRARAGRRAPAELVAGGCRAGRARAVPRETLARRELAGAPPGSRRLEKPRDVAQAPVLGERREVGAAGDRAGVADQLPREAHDVVVGVRAEGELEAVARELRLGGADHRRDAVGALARHQRVHVAGIVGERGGDQLAPAGLVAFVPGGDVGLDDGVDGVGHRQ